MNTTITNPVNLVLIIIGLFMAWTVVTFLLFSKTSKHKANVFLALIVLCFSTYFFGGFLYRFDLIETLPFAVGLNKVTTFAYGPLAYFYIRACTQKGFTWKPMFFVHFLPVLIDVLMNAPFLLLDGASKLAYFQEFIDNGNIASSKLLLTAKGVQALIYLVIGGRLIFQYRRHVFNQASLMDRTYHIWALIFLAFLSVPVITVQISLVIGDRLENSGKMQVGLNLLAFFLFFLTTYIAAFVKPQLFRTFPHQMPLPDSTESKQKKYESSNLQDDAKSKYLEKLKGYMESKKLYLEPELTLAQLAEQVNIPSHYLSQVINEKLNVSFLDYINGYRVREAQDKLKDPQLDHYTIISIAYESGFNSKSTFYAAFKKVTGMTPSQFRKQHRQVA